MRSPSLLERYGLAAMLLTLTLCCASSIEDVVRVPPHADPIATEYDAPASTQRLPPQAPSAGASSAITAPGTPPLAGGGHVDHDNAATSKGPARRVIRAQLARGRRAGDARLITSTAAVQLRHPQPLSPRMVAADSSPTAGNDDLSVPVAGETSLVRRQALALLVSQACWVEASFSLSDCAAIAYALQRRSRQLGWTLRRTTIEYSALDAPTERAELARSLRADDSPAFSRGENRAWSQVRATALAALQHRLRNPCPRAQHWNARLLKREAERAAARVKAGNWIPVRCSDRTANDFYAVNR